LGLALGLGWDSLTFSEISPTNKAPSISNLTWTTTGAQTWDTCVFHKRHCGGDCNRICDVHTHGKFLQDAQRAMLKPWHRHAPVDQRFVPDGCALGPFDADALLGSVGVNNTLWLVRTADPLQIPSEAQRSAASEACAE